jgi:hydrogenase maturation factor
MKHKGLKVKSIFYFVIIFLSSGMITSSVSSSTMKLSFSPEQSYKHEGSNHPSSLSSSSDILEMIQQVNASILRTYIQKIQEFGPHPTGSKACEAIGEYLYDTLNSFQVSVQYDSWRYKLHSGKNIVATLQGKESSDIVVVSAHYDTISISPGGNDDGSGVAVVLAAADILSHYSFNATIHFVLFSGEEQGLLGSHEYVKNASRNGEYILGDLNLDGVGYAMTSLDGNKIKHHANNESFWMVDISKTIASKYHDEIGIEVIGLPHVTFSDHESFVQYNYDASFFWQYTLAPFYHTSEDTLEHMNMTYLAKVCKLTVGTLASIAELNPRLSNDDLDISIKGRALAFPCQFNVRIENKKSMIDTANVTINIALKNLRTGQYVLSRIHTGTIICNWTFTKEIETVWEFEINGRQFSNQFISLEVIVKGIKDDVTLYSSQLRIGVIVANSIFLLPFFMRK